MCGIAGAFAYGRGRLDTDAAILERMTDALAFRGPDERGVHLDPERRVALGHRRLSIIDLSAGHQPMANDDGSIWIVYNGEVYNHDEIRRELQARGVRFRTRCDTEAILRLYEARGEDCLERLVGMFAFAIWDARRETLFLARDRIGVKPLHWCDVGGELLFASEIRSLLEHPAVPRRLDPVSLYHHLTFMSTPVPATMFEGIRKLGPGHCMTVSRQGVQVRRWWDALDAAWPDPGAPRDEAEAAHEVRERLRTAVRDRMMSDVPFGVFLSGGIDSSAVTALMAECSELPINTFTVGYAGKAVEHMNELHHARRIAERYGTRHHEVVIDPRAVLEYLPRFFEHQDEPNADPVCVPLYYVSKLAVDHGIKVIQVGEGADELFMGYPQFLQAIAFERNTRWLRRLPRGARAATFRMLSPLLRAIGHRALEWHELLRRQVDGRPFWGGAIICNDVENQRLLRAPPPGVSSWQVLRPFYEEIERRWPGVDPVATMSYVELRQRLPELLLARVDKITMSVSLEARVPFLDHRLVEYVLRLPGRLKVRGGRTKSLLKRAVADLLPSDLIHRRKQGFPAPVSEWVFEDEFGRTLLETVRKSPLIRDGLIDGAEVDRYVELHFSGREERGRLLWTLFDLTLWYRRWIRGERL